MPTYLFRRFAGSFQLRIRTFDDLVQVVNVPEAHWISTACPAKGLACDAKFIAMLDSDHDGRVRAQELKSAIIWTASMLADPRDCVPGSELLNLSHLSAAAAPLKATAELILSNLGVQERTCIDLTQVRQTKDVLNRVAANGDGIITPAGIADAQLRELATEILGLLPGVIDRSGERGIDRAMLAGFTAMHSATVAWLDAETAAKRWGPDSVEMARLVILLKDRFIEYFLQCRLVAAQPSALDSFRLTPQKLEALLGDDAALRRAVASLPMMTPEASGLLRWSMIPRGADYEALLRMRDQVVAPVLGAAAAVTLDEAGWLRLAGDAVTILAWADQAAQLPLLTLTLQRVRAITSAQITALDTLCVEDLELNNTLERAGDLEKLILFQRWLFTFSNNFVAMPELYTASGKALFDQGTLVMSGREFKLAVLVVDRVAHSAMATEASMFILYCTITGGPDGATLEVAVPVTSGTSRNLFVGKRGIFIGRDGGEYDAVVTQIIIQPVSMLEAIYMPFVRIAKFITSRVEQWSKSSSSDFDQQLAQRADKAKALAMTPPVAGAQPVVPAQPAAAAAATAAAAPAAGGQFGQILMGGGIAFAAIGSAFAFIVSEVSKLGPLDWIWGTLALVGVLAVPSAVFAWLKIYNRNLAVVLEASGWAMNDRLRLTRALGLLLSRRPARPAGSRLDFLDQVSTLIAANPEASAELKRQRRQMLAWWLSFGFAILLITYAWSGLLRTHLTMFAHALSAHWLEALVERRPLVAISATSQKAQDAYVVRYRVSFAKAVQSLPTAAVGLENGALVSIANDGTTPNTYLITVRPNGPGPVSLTVTCKALAEAAKWDAAEAQGISNLTFNFPPGQGPAATVPDVPVTGELPEKIVPKVEAPAKTETAPTPAH